MRTKLRVIIWNRPWGYEAECIDAVGNGIGGTPDEAFSQMLLDVEKQQRVSRYTDSSYVRNATEDQDTAYNEFLAGEYSSYDIDDVRTFDLTS